MMTSVQTSEPKRLGRWYFGGLASAGAGNQSLSRTQELFNFEFSSR